MAALLAPAEGLGGRLIQAATDGHDALVRQLFVLGAPLNVTRFPRGATALMIAARNGDLGIMQLLLARGADVSARDNEGRPSSDWAESGRRRPASTSSSSASTAACREAGADAASPSQSPAVAARASAPSTPLLAPIPSSRLASARCCRRWRRATTPARRSCARCRRGWPAESPEEYRANLAASVSTLDAALRAGGSASVAAVQSVAEDLEVKLEHCTMSGGKLGGAVAVGSARCQGSAEVRAWQVFYMPKVLEAAENASPGSVPQLSSPTEEALVPGRYVMWVRDPVTSTLGERTVVKVGAGKKDLLLELLVPAGTAR